MKIKESNNIPIERGCGRRGENGVYLATRLGKVGTLWWAHLMDPPIKIDAETESALGLSDLGVKIIKRHGSDIYDVWDIVGQSHYSNVCDFAMEVSVAGASRKIAPKLPLHLLDPQQSKLILLHRRACLQNASDYFDYVDQGHWMPPDWHCPRHLPEHMDPEARPEMCAGLWWHDVEGGASIDPEAQWHAPTGGLSANPQFVLRLQAVTRRMPAFTYAGWARPTNVEPQHDLGIFMVLPIHGIDVVRGDRTSDVIESLKTSPFDIQLCVA